MEMALAVHRGSMHLRLRAPVALLREREAVRASLARLEADLRAAPDAHLPFHERRAHRRRTEAVRRAWRSLDLTLNTSLPGGDTFRTGAAPLPAAPARGTPGPLLRAAAAATGAVSILLLTAAHVWLPRLRSPAAAWSLAGGAMVAGLVAWAAIGLPVLAGGGAAGAAAAGLGAAYAGAMVALATRASALRLP